MVTTEKNNHSSTLVRGLKVLELIAQEGARKGLSLQNVVSSLKINKSNAYRYLSTLCDQGWLERDDDTFHYRLGKKSLQLSGSFLYHLDLRAIARVYLQRLVEETHQTAHISILSNDQILYIDKVESNSPIQMRSFAGMVAPLYCTAMGKAILASKPVNQVSELVGGKLTKKTGHTLTTIDELITDLEKTIQRGYSFDNEENEMGISCIGAALYDFNDQVIGAISISAMTQSLDQDTIETFSAKVRQTASQISQAMGCFQDHWKLNIKGYQNIAK